MARTWQLRNECWQLPERGAIMGILNVTPDSFSDGGKYTKLDDALAQAELLISEGADVIDIGGESTRPGATPITATTEKRRVLPVIRALRQRHPELRISIDTRHAATARAALEAGVDIVNDITALTDPAMRDVCAQYPCGIVIMHLNGSPFEITEGSYYCDIVKDVRNYFEERVSEIEAAGISLSRVCLDPGIGFHKRTEQNLTLISRIGETRVRDLPILMGLSRKRFLQELRPPVPNTLGIKVPPFPQMDPKDATLPTVGMSMLAAENGADVHRVHDVAAHREALELLYEEYLQVSSGNITNPLFIKF